MATSEVYRYQDESPPCRHQEVESSTFKSAAKTNLAALFIIQKCSKNKSCSFIYHLSIQKRSKNKFCSFVYHLSQSQTKILELWPEFMLKSIMTLFPMFIGEKSIHMCRLSHVGAHHETMSPMFNREKSNHKCRLSHNGAHHDTMLHFCFCFLLTRGSCMRPTAKNKQNTTLNTRACSFVVPLNTRGALHVRHTAKNTH